MLSIFSCVYWSFVFLLWRNVCLGLLPIFWIVFCCWVVWVVCTFWKLSLCWSHCLQIFSPIGCLFFSFLKIIYFAVQKLVSLIRILLCSRLIDNRYVGLFLGSWFCFIDLYVFFVPIPCCFDYCRSIVLSDVWEGYVSYFVLYL